MLFFLIVHSRRDYRRLMRLDFIATLHGPRRTFDDVKKHLGKRRLILDALGRRWTDRCGLDKRLAKVQVGHQQRTISMTSTKDTIITLNFFPHSETFHATTACQAKIHLKAPSKHQRYSILPFFEICP